MPPEFADFLAMCTGIHGSNVHAQLQYDLVEYLSRLRAEML
jgi:hypothetical protein